MRIFESTSPKIKTSQNDSQGQVAIPANPVVGLSGRLSGRSYTVFLSPLGHFIQRP